MPAIIQSKGQVQGPFWSLGHPMLDELDNVPRRPETTTLLRRYKPSGAEQAVAHPRHVLRLHIRSTVVD